MSTGHGGMIGEGALRHVGLRTFLRLEMTVGINAAHQCCMIVRTGNLLMVSGQICLDSGKLVAKGQLGGGVSIEDGQKAARACAVNLLAQVKVAVGDLDNVSRVVRLGGFVNSAPGFLEGPTHPPPPQSGPP